MILHRIDYNGGDIWADREICKSGELAYSTKTNKVFVVDKVDLSSTPVAYYMAHGILCPIKNAVRVVAQSTNLSLPNIPYVEIEKDFHSELIRLLFRITDENVPLFGSQRLQSLHNDAGTILERLLATPAKKYTDEDLIAFGKKCFYKGFNKSETDDANCFTAWREESFNLIQSLQPKPVNIEVEMTTAPNEEGIPNCFDVLATYVKDGKTFVKVKKVNYELGRSL